MIINDIDKEKSLRELEKAIILMYEEMMKNANSTKKIKPLHYWVASNLQIALGENFCVYADGFKKYKNKNEVNIKGKYTNKNVDVAVYSKKKNDFVGAIEIKAPMKSIGKNLANHFENLLGYTANIRSNNLVFGHFNIYRLYSPVFGKNPNLKSLASNYLTKIEKLDTVKLKGFTNLMNEPKSIMHRPDALMLYVVDFKNENIYEKYLNQQVYDSVNTMHELIKHAKITSINIFQNEIKNNNISFNPINFINHFALLCLAKSTDDF